MNLEGFHSIERLGRGGFATVFAAVSADDDRPVIIKVLDRFDDVDRDHIHRQLTQVGSLNSLPGVVDFIALVETPDGDLAIVQEQVAGGSIADTVAQYPRGVGESDAAWVAGRMLEVLAVAHQSGIVHTSLRPSNVLFGDGTAKITDFEMTAVASSPAWSGAALASDAMFVAPELLMGQPPEPSADMFSVGLIAYFLATGRRTSTSSTAAIAWAARGTEPLELDVSGLSAEFAEWIGTAVSHDPTQRPQSALDAMAKLSRVAPVEPSSALSRVLNAKAYNGRPGPADQSPPSQPNPVVPPHTGANPTIVMPAVSVGLPPEETWDPPTSRHERIERHTTGNNDLGSLASNQGGDGGYGQHASTGDYPMDRISPVPVNAGIDPTTEMVVPDITPAPLYGRPAPEGPRQGSDGDEYDHDEPDRRMVLAFSALALVVISVIGVVTFKLAGNVVNGNTNGDEQLASPELGEDGARPLVVPSTVGLLAQDATSQLRELGLFVQIVEEVNDAVRDGYVISQSVPPETVGRPGQTITLTVSTGPAKVPLPDLLNISEAEALARLSAMGFAAAVDYKDVDYGSPDAGNVVFQDPAAGVPVDEETPIVLTVGQPPQACEIKADVAAPSPVSFVPPLVRGDADFGSNGPRMDLQIDLVAEAHQLGGIVTLKGEETRRDFTTVSGTKNIVLYTAPEGWEIRSVAVSPVFSHRYKDSDEQQDVFSFNEGFVTNLSYVGDIRGPEAGTLAGVTISFNQISLELVEAGDCVIVEDLDVNDDGA